VSPEQHAGRRVRGSGLQRLSLLTIGCTLLLVALGGLVRATDNGLACPDWPRCYGVWLPRQADLPEGLALARVWVEHTHRLVAMLVGVLIAAVLIWAIARYRDRRDVLWPAIAAAVAVNVQAALGGVVVLKLLRAELVTAHLGMAMIMVGGPAAGEQSGGRDRRFPRAAAAVAGLALVQILVGGHVTGVGAGLAFAGFPLFDGALVPAVTSADQAWHVLHRLLAVALGAAVALLAWLARGHVRRLEAGLGPAWPRPWLVRLPDAAAGLVALQVGLGAANLYSGLSAWTVTPHLAVASWIWTLLVAQTVLAYRTTPARRALERAPSPVETGTVTAAPARPSLWERGPVMGPR
jgi:heme A synthase